MTLEFSEYSQDLFLSFSSQPRGQEFNLLWYLTSRDDGSLRITLRSESFCWHGSWALDSFLYLHVSYSVLELNCYSVVWNCKEFYLFIPTWYGQINNETFFFAQVFLYPNIFTSLCRSTLVYLLLVDSCREKSPFKILSIERVHGTFLSGEPRIQSLRACHPRCFSSSFARCNCLHSNRNWKFVVYQTALFVKSTNLWGICVCTDCTCPFFRWKCHALQWWALGQDKKY